MSSLAGLSASVTRILYLTGFPKELKTKDIQAAFADWEGVNGGYKIKWRDDTSLLIVFQDPSIAKRAYLRILAYPPSILTSTNGVQASIRPYDGPDAQAVIQNVNSRGQHNSNASRHNNRSASISVFPSSRSRNGNGNGNGGNGGGLNHHISIPDLQNSNGGREPSPTLPNLPSHPTLNSLISSSLGEAVTNPNGTPPSDPAILTTSLSSEQGGPRIGDPGKRMLGAALGLRHPGLGPRTISGSPDPSGIKEVQKAMGGLVVAE